MIGSRNSVRRAPERGVSRRARLGVAAIALALLATLTAPGGASARMGQNQSYTFDVVWSLFPEMILANGALSLERSASVYSIGLVMRAKLMAPAIDWRGRFAVDGEQSHSGGLNPKRFLRESVRPMLRETVVVDWVFSPEDEPETFIRREPAFTQPEREEIDPEEIRNVIDPLSFLAQLLTRVEESNGDSCELEAKTWDGVRLAKIRTETLETLRAARIDCKVVYDRIVGMRKDTPWREQEETTNRVVRFSKERGVWRPKWLKIEGEFGGFRSTFTTRIKPAEG